MPCWLPSLPPGKSPSARARLTSGACPACLASDAPAPLRRPCARRQQRRGLTTSQATSSPSASAGGGRKITQSEFTDKAWQAIVSAPDIAKEYSHQIVETEHLWKALLEQPNGLARRIIFKAGSDPTRLLEKTDAFLRR